MAVFRLNSVARARADNRWVPENLNTDVSQLPTEPRASTCDHNARTQLTCEEGAAASDTTYCISGAEIWIADDEGQPFFKQADNDPLNPLWAVLMHELGHVLGMTHPLTPSSCQNVMDSAETKEWVNDSAAPSGRKEIPCDRHFDRLLSSARIGPADSLGLQLLYGADRPGLEPFIVKASPDTAGWTAIVAYRLSGGVPAELQLRLKSQHPGPRGLVKDRVLWTGSPTQIWKEREEKRENGRRDKVICDVRFDDAARGDTLRLCIPCGKELAVLATQILGTSR
ncbi:MAG: hypothetical protein IPK72_21750 [Candidatus Eisenbacteria bacterium]|nr:hypothetical protein [Candidatus Eisenbacteria bacterium]